jgi:integrase
VTATSFWEHIYAQRKEGFSPRVWTWRKDRRSVVSVQGPFPHDFRRSAVRNLVNSGVDTATAMKITRHRTLHIFMRYNIISTGQLHEAMDKVTSKKKPVK